VYVTIALTHSVPPLLIYHSAFPNSFFHGVDGVNDEYDHAHDYHATGYECGG
jgi:hypothetical protein